MTDTSELIAELRKPAPPFGMEEYDPTYDIRQTAADTIARLTADVDRLERERQDADRVTTHTLDTMQDTNAQLTKRLDDLLFENAKLTFDVLDQRKRADLAEEQLRQAVKVIEPFAKAADVFDANPDDWPEGKSEHVDNIRAARTFLASLAKKPQT